MSVFRNVVFVAALAGLVRDHLAEVSPHTCAGCHSREHASAGLALASI